MRRLIVSVLLCCSTAFAKDHSSYFRGDPFDLRVVSVRSVLPSDGQSSKHEIELFRIEAVSSGPDNHKYVLYCAQASPESNHVYKAQTVYLDERDSIIHLWPVERQTLGLNEKGRLYRAIEIFDVFNDKRKDLVCETKEVN